MAPSPRAEMDCKAHWEQVYRTKAPTEVSWYQEDPALSLRFIASTGVGPQAHIVDVGGGSSILVDRLLDRGFEHLTIVDLSAGALRRAKERLGKRADRVQWLEADARDLVLPERVDVWHDRALFHFLTETEDRARYLQAVRRSLTPQGHLIMATFAVEGPPQCSGLAVARYSPEALAQTMGPNFAFVEACEDIHLTPWRTQQPFIYARFKRVSG